MFERFTDRARRVIVLAQEEARILNHNYIGTEHLLLGLVHEGEGVAAEALDGLGISLEAVREQVGEIIGRGSRPLSGHIPFTPRAKKVLELSLREALDLGHNFIGPEHILLGLIREGGGVAAQVLVNLGGDLEQVRDRVAALVSGAGAGAGRPAAQRRPMRVAEAPPAQLEQILHALGMIDARLAAIEQHLGLRPPGAAPEGTARPDEPPGAARAAPGDPARPAAPPGDPGEPAAG